MTVTAQILEFLVTTAGRCTEAAVLGKALFSPDETHIAQLAPGGFARFRERTPGFDRAASRSPPVGDGSLSYSAMVRWPVSAFDAAMQSWLSHLLPEVFARSRHQRSCPCRASARGGWGFHVCFNRFSDPRSAPSSNPELWISLID